jgi:hypothetical protein
VSSDIRPETCSQAQRKVIDSLQSVRIHMDAIQWKLTSCLSHGEAASPGFCDNACEEMRSWANGLMDAADGLEASLNP